MVQNTVLRICKGIPWDNTYQHVRLFDSKTARDNYIQGKSAYTYTNYGYIAKSNVIVVEGKADLYRDCNYIAWQNQGYSNRWFYAFIKDVIYVSDNSTNIVFEVDLFQTWFYDVTIKPCYVEREHVNDDTVGLHTVPENVIMGDPVNVASSNNYIPHKWFMYATQVFKQLGQDGFTWTDPGGEGNEVSGYYKINLNDRSQANRVVELYTRKGCLESLISMFALTDDSSTSSDKTYTITPPDSFGGYVPKNNKLFCYPYNYCTLVMAGSETIYRYEWFEDRKPGFHLKTPKYAGGSSYIYPTGYMKESDTTQSFALENSVPTGAYPTASFGANQFQNYLVQYGPQLAIGLITQAVSGVLGTATGTAITPLSNAAEDITGYGGIANSIMDLRTRSLNSHTVAGTQAVSNLAYDTQLIIRITAKQILPEYVKIIDEYFNAFGYKVCVIKQPNITGRTSWNYVKTIGANVQGNVPESAKASLRELLNLGVTFWHVDDIGNYSLDNSIKKV